MLIGETSWMERSTWKYHRNLGLIKKAHWRLRGWGGVRRVWGDAGRHGSIS